jgi:hypothetical protein
MLMSRAIRYLVIVRQVAIRAKLLKNYHSKVPFKLRYKIKEAPDSFPELL